MKKALLIIGSLAMCVCTYATHITGGELMYQHLGPGTPGSDIYKVTVRLFRDCYSNGPLLQNEQIRVGIYRNSQLQQTIQLPLSQSIFSIALNTSTIPCLSGNPQVCYQVAYYTATVELPKSDVGYTLVESNCCRIGGITNIVNSTGAGATYTTKIPGTSTGPNNSAEFLLKDTALVCSNRNIRLPFTAFDRDGDSLSYSFCDAYGNVNSNNQPLPASLTLTTLNYQSPYNGLQPLGGNVTINPKTGVISGRGPSTGRYVVAVCATEWRNGVKINEHRKDFILSVQACDFVSAELPDPRVVCDDFNVHFESLSYSSSITSYAWDFGDPSSSGDTSKAATPSYTYPDTGVYRVKLIVTGNNGCTDSTYGDVHVFPGFSAGFTSIAGCVKNPVLFRDSSSARYGTVNSWSWDFGNVAVNNDTSTLKNTSYQYATTGTYNVQLIATSSKGCIDTIMKPVTVTDKPYLQLPFKDTVVCGFDTLQLIATGNGSFSWSPNNFMIGNTTSNPTVYPPASTSYTVTLNDNGCFGSETIRITKRSNISVNVGNDTLICTSDTIALHAVSAGNYYTWTPANLVANPAIANTSSKTILKNSTLYVQSVLGRCSASDSINIVVSPYPDANAGTDASICPGTKTQLTGSIVGDRFTWSPANAMLNGTSLHPQVAPTFTTSYVLTALNNAGCLKPVRDTVLVTVLPPAIAFAGNDTSIVDNQPLQLHGSGGESFVWSPNFNLSSSTTSNPFVTFPPGKDTLYFILKVINANGCTDDDEIMVTRFKGGTNIFVPTAFTPNSDGRNDVLRPNLAGIKQINFFRIYNRWGQLLYETKDHGRGWDGTLHGTEQSPGTYVYFVQATDYKGNVIVQKGTSVLIR